MRIASLVAVETDRLKQVGAALVAVLRIALIVLLAAVALYVAMWVLVKVWGVLLWAAAGLLATSLVAWLLMAPWAGEALVLGLACLGASLLGGFFAYAGQYS